MRRPHGIILKKKKKPAYEEHLGANHFITCMNMKMWVLE